MPGETEKAVHGAEAVEAQMRKMAARAQHVDMSQQMAGEKPAPLRPTGWGTPNSSTFGSYDGREDAGARAGVEDHS